MADDPTKRGPQDRTRINIHEPWEVKWWCQELGVNEAALKNAVSNVGVMVKDVRKFLGK